MPYQKKLLESLDNKGIFVLAYLYRYRAVWGNVVWLTINQLITWCGYVGGNKTRNMVAFKDILQSYIKLGWIEVVNDIDIEERTTDIAADVDGVPDNPILTKMKINDPFQIIVNHDKIPIFDMNSKVKGGWVKFTFKEMDEIRLADTNFDVGNLGCAFLSTKQFIAEDNADENKSIVPNEYKCKIAHPTLDYLMNIADIKSTGTISKYMDELVRLGLLYDIKCGTILTMKNGGYIKFDTPTCYALEERFLVQAEESLKEYYGVDKITPCNEEKDKPPINNNPVRPNKVVKQINMEQEEPVLQDSSIGDEVNIPIDKSDTISLTFEVAENESNNVPNIVEENFISNKYPWETRKEYEQRILAESKIEDIQSTSVERLSDKDWLHSDDTFETEYTDVLSIGKDSSDNDDLEW